MRIILPVLMAFMAASASAPATAQDGSEFKAERTVAGAQEFIRELFQTSGGFVFYKLGDFYALNGYGQRLKTMSPIFAYLNIGKIEAPTECSTLITLTPSPEQLGQMKGVIKEKWTPIQTVEIDWRTVGTVQRQGVGSNIGITVPSAVSRDGEVRIVFNIKEWELGGRLFFAAQFLREKCQIQSKTGF